MPAVSIAKLREMFNPYLDTRLLPPAWCAAPGVRLQNSGICSMTVPCARECLFTLWGWEVGPVSQTTFVYTHAGVVFQRVNIGDPATVAG